MSVQLKHHAQRENISRRQCTVQYVLMLAVVTKPYAPLLRKTRSVVVLHHNNIVLDIFNAAGMDETDHDTDDDTDDDSDGDTDTDDANDGKHLKPSQVKPC